jgi:small subunit ribosomal protein S9
MAEKKNIIWSTGRRKTAVARVRLFPGAGTILINQRSLEDYFPRDTSRMLILEPFELTETKGQFDIVVSVEGGGNDAPPGATQGRYAHSRPARGRAQEVRPPQGAQASAILEALVLTPKKVRFTEGRNSMSSGLKLLLGL